jgi:glycerol-3-phosphate dehydrogenase
MESSGKHSSKISMNREEMLNKIEYAGVHFDFIIIGGGASGAGVALEAISRGYSVVLFEKYDFAKSTSGKSTKLVHGGVRYLAQGNLGLVREACVERGRLLKNAPHLVKNLSFIIPAFGLYDELLYYFGLKFYDLLAGRYSMGRSKRVGFKETLRRLPGLRKDKLSAGILYHDGQFDDSRLALNVIQTAAELGARVLNYTPVIDLLKDVDGRLSGVVVVDSLSGKEIKVLGKTIVNTTGVFVDEIMQMDNPEKTHSVRSSQGIHIVIDKSFLPGEEALMIPKTDDGRVLFAVPWHNVIILGTTDTPVESSSPEPVALEEEIDFVLNTAGRYLLKAPARSDVKSVFAGLRPLAVPTGKSRKTKEISRSHKIIISKSGLFTMVGGKWTTFRKMAEDMVSKVESIKLMPPTKSVTKNLKIHGYKSRIDYNDPMYFYGSDQDGMLDLIHENPALGVYLSESLGIIKAQLIWAIRHEMAVTVEDFLSRRTRCLLLDAVESIRMAPQVAKIMADELGKDKKWIKKQVEEFTELGLGYMVTDFHF